MGKIIEVDVRVGVTKNIGNYESARLDYGVRAILDDGEKPGEQLAKLRKTLQTLATHDVGKIVANK